MPTKARNIAVLAGISGAIVLGLFFFVLWPLFSKPAFDPFLKAVFATTAKTSSYSQAVETESPSEGATLRILGTYLVDSGQSRFASYSTTTLSQAGGPSVVFQLADISIGTDVYVRLTNKTPQFRLSVPANGTWVRFPANAIPAAYDGIAIAGPQMEGLKLLADNGAYLALLKKEQPQAIAGKPLLPYAFALSKAGLAAEDPDIRQVADRIGPKGTIEFWFDASSTEPVYLRLSDGAGYVSTTTFSRFSEALGIEAPPGVK